MTAIERPSVRPASPYFSSGPCAKRPGWSLDALSGAFLSRSHRAKGGLAKLRDVIDRSRAILGLPEEYRLGIVPASDTGAVEMALWSLLGERGVDMLAWESFGKTWVEDVTKQLRLKDVRILEAPYGQIPDLSQVDWSRDVVFTWNGTTGGACVPDGAWIAEDRQGLSIADATSATFAMDIPWRKIDVATWSWQKVLGGEAAHGMVVLSPRAVERLERFTPDRPIPKLFRMTNKGKLIEGLFKGETINTPSMLAVEDALDGLIWAESIGGLQELIARSQTNLAAVAAWVEQSSWCGFLVKDAAIRSSTSICLTIETPAFQALPEVEQRSFVARMVALLEQEGVAYDIASYRDAPPGLRLWGGATVESADMRLLLPWLDWAYAQIATDLLGKAA